MVRAQDRADVIGSETVDVGRSQSGLALLPGVEVGAQVEPATINQGQRRDVLRLLRPVAACGAALAVVTGALLFTVQARDYVALPAFWLKLGLVGLGLAHALANPAIGAAPRGRQRLAGVLSLAVWLAALVLGRLLGYL